MKLTNDGFVNSPDEFSGQGHHVYQRDTDMVFLSDYAGLWSVSVSSSERDAPRFYVTQEAGQIPDELDTAGYRACLMPTEQLTDCLYNLIPWLASKREFFQPDTLHLVPTDSEVAPIMVTLIWLGKALEMVTLGDNSTVVTSQAPVVKRVAKSEWGIHLADATPTPKHLTGDIPVVSQDVPQEAAEAYYEDALAYSKELHVLDGVFMLTLADVHAFFRDEVKFANLQEVDTITGSHQKVITPRHGCGETLTISLPGVMTKANKDLWQEAVMQAGFARATCATRGHGTCAFTCFSITLKAKEFNQQ